MWMYDGLEDNIRREFGHVYKIAQGSAGFWTHM